MKLGASVALVISYADASNLLAVRGQRRESLSLVAQSKPRGVLHFGDTACPCIGFDNIEGVTSVELEGGEKVEFPADLGARCEKWDDGVHPKCKGKDKPDWCQQSWCFVDGCNCRLPVLPKLSVYAGDALYRGKPIYFSYATCGGEDTWSKVLPEVGTAGCRCIGFDNIPGSTTVTIGGEKVAYPAEIGGSCQAWDDDLHPLCKGDKPEPWCKAKWCYVDPCSCSLPQKPKVTMYLPDATFTGKSLYYSYETCGSEDTFTAKHNTEACVNQLDKASCLALKRSDDTDKCAWSKGACLGAELVNHPLCERMVDEVVKAKLEPQEAAEAEAQAPGEAPAEHKSGAAAPGALLALALGLAALPRGP